MLGVGSLACHFHSEASARMGSFLVRSHHMPWSPGLPGTYTPGPPPHEAGLRPLVTEVHRGLSFSQGHESQADTQIREAERRQQRSLLQRAIWGLGGASCKASSEKASPPSGAARGRVALPPAGPGLTGPSGTPPSHASLETHSVGLPGATRVLWGHCPFQGVVYNVHWFHC